MATPETQICDACSDDEAVRDVKGLPAVKPDPHPPSQSSWGWGPVPGCRRLTGASRRPPAYGATVEFRRGVEVAVWEV
jgi:hypothetical protein